MEVSVGFPSSTPIIKHEYEEERLTGQNIMAPSDLSDSELDELEDIINDLEHIFEKERIKLDEIDELEDRLDSQRVRQYLRDLRRSSKPEAALREELVAGDSPLAKYFFGDDFSPESGLAEGFVDYQVGDTPPILLELKPPFTPVYNSDGNLQYLKKQELDWRKHRDQIEKYLKRNEYLLFTNLDSWDFFSRYSEEDGPINEASLDIREFYSDSHRASSLKDYLDRLQGQAGRGDLDETFFKSLKRWVSELEKVDFKQGVTEYQRTEYIVNSINKFIFVQTLDSYSVIDFRWIENNWEENDQKWSNLGDKEFLQRFLSELTEWFHAYYDTELFKGTILDYVQQDQENLSTLKKSLKKVLGLEEYQQKNVVPGITNYNFREIDEDIFGKAYETYLAEIRKEQGIFYTPKYITKYIVEDTVGEKFGAKADEIEQAIKEENFEKAGEVIDEFTSLTVLDPACGSGSFLIKSLRAIWAEYQRVLTTIRAKKEEHEGLIEGKLSRAEEDQRVYEAMNELEARLDFADERELVSKIVLRHLYGNDLDSRALDVAKLNIWLESIKLAPNQFHYQNIPEGEGYVLPDLEWNLSHGDSLVGLPVERTISHLENSHSAKLSELANAREGYLNDPTDETSLHSGVETLGELRSELDGNYQDYIDDQGIDQDPFDSTVPFYWGLQFWHAFRGDENGFDVVIGNPPYVGEKERKERFELLKECSIVHECYQGRMDMLYFFVLLGVKLSNSSGLSSMITTAYWPEADSAGNLRREIANRTSVEEILGFDGFTVFEQAPGQENLVYKFNNSGSEEITFSYLRSAKYETDAVAESLLEGKDLFYQGTYDYEEFDLPSDGSEWYGLKGLAKGALELPDTGQTFSDLLESKQGIVPNPDKVTKQSYEDYENDDVEIDEGVFLLKSKDLDRIGISENHTLLKPAYRNSDIYKYHIDYSEDLHLLYITSDVDIDQYPLIKNHLKRYKSKLDDRREVEEGKISWYSLQWPRDSQLFQNPKIVYSNWGNDWQPYAVEDQEYYERRDITLLKPKKSDIDLHRLTALLNSRLSEYWQSEKRSRSGYTTQGSLDEMPIPTDLPDSLSSKAKVLRKQKEARAVLKNEILAVADQLKKADQTLETIFDNDRQKRQAGNRNQTWSKEVSFYPDQDNDNLTEEFEDFAIDVCSDEPRLVIKGLDGQREIEVYEVLFRSRELLQLVYLEIEELLDSRSHVNTLQDILTKAEIPIIGAGTAQKTPNIVKDAVESFEEWQANEGRISLSPDITLIDEKVNQELAKVDALIFDAYDLDRSDAATVLDALEVRNSQKSKIMSQF